MRLAISGDLTRWVLAILGQPEVYKAERILRNLFDSLSAEIRDAAWQWLITPTGNSQTPSAGYNDPVLWSRLLETPWDDQRACGWWNICGSERACREQSRTITSRLVYRAAGSASGRKAKGPGGAADCPGDRCRSAQAEALLPVLAVAVRSVRPPELRAAWQR